MTGHIATSFGSDYLEGKRNSALLSQNQRLFCTPNNTSVAETVRIVVKHLKNNRGFLDESPGRHVGLALSRAYPCK